MTGHPRHWMDFQSSVYFLLVANFACYCRDDCHSMLVAEVLLNFNEFEFPMSVYLEREARWMLLSFALIVKSCPLIHVSFVFFQGGCRRTCHSVRRRSALHVAIQRAGCESGAFYKVASVQTRMWAAKRNTLCVNLEREARAQCLCCKRYFFDVCTHDPCTSLFVDMLCLTKKHLQALLDGLILAESIFRHFCLERRRWKKGYSGLQEPINAKAGEADSVRLAAAFRAYEREMGARSRSKVRFKEQSYTLRSAVMHISMALRSACICTVQKIDQLATLITFVLS